MIIGNKEIKILAIYVLYNPNLDLVSKSLKGVYNEVDEIWISDNSSVKHSFTGDKVKYIFLNGNRGIAYAQNKGIEYAIQNTFDWIIFFDQDSTFEEGFLTRLYNSFQNLLSMKKYACGLSPLAVNRDSGMTLNTESELFEEKIGDEAYIKMRELMCSSSIFTVEIFKRVGLMDASLFIDGVDYEICWRAASLENSEFYCVKDCVLQHQLGEGDRSFMGRKLHITAPFRLYYEVRNVLWLCRRSYVPLKWRIKQLTKLLVKSIFYPLFVSPRLLYLKNFLRGLRDGLKPSKTFAG